MGNLRNNSGFAGLANFSLMRPLILAIVLCAADESALGGSLAEPAAAVDADPPGVAIGKPIAGGYGVAARGRADYLTYCAPCHGPAGNGDGPLAAMLVPRPSRHTDAKLMNAITDDDLFRLLSEGGPALGKSPLMGAWGKYLSAQQIRDLLAFTRALVVPDR